MSNQFTSVLEKLSARDSRLPNLAIDLSQNYHSIYLKNRKLESENDSFRRENHIFKQTTSDPEAIQKLRDANSEIQRKLTQSYEDSNKLRDNLAIKTEEALKLSAQNSELLRELNALKEKQKVVDSNLKIKDESLDALAKEFKSMKEDRDKLLAQRDALQSELTKTKDEMNQFVNQALIQKQALIEQINEMNVLNDVVIKKSKQLEEERKLFEEQKKKFLENNQKGDKKSDDIDLKVYYSDKKKETSTELTFIKKMKVHEKEIYNITEAPTGDVVATCGGDSLIKFIDPNRSQPYLTLKAPSTGQIITSIAFGYDNDSFLGGTSDKSVYLWSLSTSRIKHTFNGHSDRVATVAFMKDMTRVVTGSHDRSIKIWDSGKGSIIKTIMCGAMCNSLKITSDKTRIISGHSNGSVKVWSAKNGDLIKTFSDLHEKGITSVMLDLDSSIVLTGSKDCSCKMIDLRMDKPLEFSFKHDSYYNTIDFNQVSFANFGHSVIAGGQDNQLYMWNAENAKVQHVLKTSNEGGITSCCYNVLSGHVYSGDNAGNVVIWN